MPQIEHTAKFSTDVSRQVAYLRDRGEFTLIETLRVDLSDLEDLLRRFPLSGRQPAAQGTDLLLKLRLRRAPFYVWYSFDPGAKNAPVRLYRLFHVRQQTLRPRLP